MTPTRHLITLQVQNSGGEPLSMLLSEVGGSAGLLCNPDPGVVVARPSRRKGAGSTSGSSLVVIAVTMTAVALICHKIQKISLGFQI
jgi:hypothetical protein